MLQGLRARAWLCHVAVAVAYGIGLTIFRAVSIPHWVILTGFQLSVLLLTRYRYWPALVVAEVVRLAYVSYTCVDQFGMLWAALNLVPNLIFAMPVAYFCRERWGLFPSKASVNMGAFLACALLAASFVTFNSVVMLDITPLPPGYVVHYGEAAGRWFLGYYLGILTITPFVLFVHSLWGSSSLPKLWQQMAESRLLFESMCLGVPAFAVLIWLGMTASSHSQVREMAQIMMFMPVVWLALRHGWQGAAVGGMAASFSLMALMPERYDHSTMEAETAIAFAISTMLLVGARIAVLDRRAEQERMDSRMAIALAQRNVYAGEMQLKMTAQALEQVRDSVQHVCTMMLGRLRSLQPHIDDAGYRLQAITTQDHLYRLADGLYPAGWGERGLPTVLREGSLVRALDEAGIVYWSDIRGPISRLSAPLHLALYRIACESVAELCGKKDVSDIMLRVRCGEREGRAWALLRIRSCAHPVRTAHVRWQELLPRVMRTSSGGGLRAVADRAATFEGRYRDRHLQNGRSISVWLLDPETPRGL
jgi:glucose-6-phosphate-specific signal transduction histidine kinase